jgi:hypothetical protein
MLEAWEQPSGPERRSSGSWHVPVPAARSGFAPLPLPLSVSGLTPALEELATPALREFNLAPIAAGGKAKPGSKPDTAALQPGAAVGVALVDGDVQFSGIGTLTHREGNRILAFGHPMFQAGTVNMPLIGGVIHSVLPSFATSFKLFSPTAAVGVVNQDRLAAIGGIIGPVAPMTPVNVRLSSPSGKDKYRFRIMEQEQLAPVLVALALTDIVYQTEGSLEPATLTSRMTVRFRPDPSAASPSPLIVTHIIADVNPAATVFSRVKTELEIVYGNRFEVPPVESIDIELEFTPGQDFAYLVSIQPDRQELRAGDTVRAILKLRDYRGQESERAIAIPVPRSVPAGTLNIIILPRDSLLALETGRAPATLQPRSLSGILRILSETGREDELLAVGFVRTPGFTVGDAELPTPPPSLRSVLQNTRSDASVAATNASPLFRVPIVFDRPILGSAHFDLEVKK